MINMEYRVWKETCENFLTTKKSVLNKYLQLFPFTLLTAFERERIASEDFFEVYIKGGGLFSDLKTFEIPNRYLQKSDSSFRVTKLVSPILYLYLLAMGTQISREYVNQRESTKVYHAGKVENFLYHYKDSYEDFFADINESQEIYNYFIKIDLTNFFGSLDINELFEKINKEKEILDPRTILIYKNILNLIGNEKFPIVENNAGLSYLATEIYLDNTDLAIESYLSKLSTLKEFQLIRYVDDLFIFYNCEDVNMDNIVTEVKNELISIYSKAGLSMNENKYEYGKTENIHEVLYTILYDFYVNDDKVEFSQLYDTEDLIEFFNNLIKILPNHSHDSYNTSLKKAFKKEGITYSEKEVLKYFLFSESNLFEDENVKKKIAELIMKDYKILKYSTADMVMAVCNTSDEKITKMLLDQILVKHSSKNIDTFDESIVISYLINISFDYSEFEDVGPILSQNLSIFMQNYCITSFFNRFEENIKYNNLYNFQDEKYDLLIKDQIIWFQFFMFKYFDKENRTLESYSYLKVFFDRLVAHVMFCKGYDQESRKPNYKKYYTNKATTSNLEKLGLNLPDNKTILSILKEAHDLRNHNPINHSSSEILNNDQISSSELKESKKDLLLLIDLLLETSSKL